SIRELKFFQRLAYRRFMRRSEPVDEERAIQVIGLVLNDPRHETFDLAHDFVARKIVRLNLDIRVPHDRRTNSRDAQTPLFIFFLPAPAAEHGIDKYVLAFLRIPIAFFIGYE